MKRMLEVDVLQGNTDLSKNYSSRVYGLEEAVNFDDRSLIFRV